MNIIQVKNFKNFVNQQTVKNKIIIHGTASGNAQGSIQWLSGQAGKNVSVHFVIDKNGDIYQLVPEKYFSYNAGANFRKISQTSFSIEIVNWLNLQFINGKYYSWTKKQIDPLQVKIIEPWRNATAFQAITPQQHLALQDLLKYLCQKYNIKKKLYREYDPNAGFNKNEFNGILFHSSFHPSKMDFPPNLIPKISI